MKGRVGIKPGEICPMIMRYILQDKYTTVYVFTM